MIRTLITVLALTGSAHAATTVAVHVFPPTGGTVPVSLSLTTPLPLRAPVHFALRGDLLLFPGINVPPALSALLIAELPTQSPLTPYAGVGIGTATQFSSGNWTLHPTWTGVAGLRATLNSGFGLSIETRASRAAIGVAAGLTYEFPLGRTP
jgi:hypothetical protein